MSAMSTTGTVITEEVRYKEYLNEIPYNTLKTWYHSMMNEIDWRFQGWAGDPREPYRHWASYPEIGGLIKEIWKAINYSLTEDGFNLTPTRAIANLYAHGDSSWLHTDCDKPSAWTVICFLNEYWDIKWGGDFVLVENNEILKAFAPTPGKFVAFRSNILHAARPVSREAPIPRLGLAFQCDNNLQGLPKTQVSALSTPL